MIASIEEAAKSVSIEEVRASSVVVPTAYLATITRNFEDRTLGWSLALGFAPGLTSAQVKEAARAALGATEQLATIARGELEELTPLLRVAYPIIFADDG